LRQLDIKVKANRGDPLQSVSVVDGHLNPDELDILLAALINGAVLDRK
jgi:hypothetical protein